MNWDKFVKIATNIAQQRGFPLGVLLGQAAQETGRNPNNAPNNNWFGMNADKIAQYKDLMAQHKFLVGARDAAQNTVGGFSKFPKTLLSKSIGQGEATQGFLGKERLTQAGLRALLMGATLGSTALGVPKELTIPLAMLEALSVAPYLGEGVAKTMSQKENQLGGLLKKPINSQNLMRALQQLGVRLPSLGSGQ